jgi:hypothetical protein
MDIIVNHAIEISHGTCIYDYMIYAKYRWKNRLVRWLFDDPRFDRTINETLQSCNHLCFSPQYYFMVSYYSWGTIMLLMSYTVM